MAEVNTELRGEDFSSRFQVLERPTVYPGQCACCGSVNRPVVDFGVEIDFEREGYGALLLCEYCVRQAASKFPEEPVAESEDMVLERALADQKRALYDGLLGYLNTFDPRGAVIPIYGSADSVSEQTESDYVQDIIPELREESESPDGDNLEASSDDSGEGPPRVSSNSSDGADTLNFLRGL